MHYLFLTFLLTVCSYRCSVFVWVVQLFGLFGCFNLFIFASWLTILDTIEDIVSDRVALAQSTCFLNNTNSTLNTEGFDTETLADLVAALHYTLPTPFICVFIYSFFYEYTFFERDASKSKQQDDTLNVAEHSGEQSPKQKLREYFLNLALHCACGVIGSVVMLVYCVVCMKVIFHDPIFQSFSASCYKRQNAGDQYMKLIPYTIVSVAICIVSFFSEKILTIRQSIIAKFFKDQSEECNSAADNKTRVVARGTQNRKNGTTSSKK